MNILTARKLTTGYKPDRPLLENADLSLEAGRIAVIIGENGSGKSTLLRTLCGFLPPLGGSIELCGHPLAELSGVRLARLLSMVTTDPTMAGGLSVAETVAIGRQPHTGIFGRLSAADRAIVREAMEAVGIAGKAGARLHELSDGERQKAMIARAMAQRTPLMLMDEPTSFLDAGARIDTMALLRRLVDESQEGMSVLLSTHDIAPALAVADDVWVLDPSSRTMISGPKAGMTASGALDRAFAGRGIRFDPVRGDYTAASDTSPNLSHH